MWACRVVASVESVEDTGRSLGQTNYFLVERCLLFDSPIPRVAKGSVVFWTEVCVRVCVCQGLGMIKEVLIGACCEKLKGVCDLYILVCKITFFAV